MAHNAEDIPGLLETMQQEEDWLAGMHVISKAGHCWQGCIMCPAGGLSGTCHLPMLLESPAPVLVACTQCPNLPYIFLHLVRQYCYGRL